MKILFTSFFNGMMNTLTAILTVLFYLSGVYLFANVPIVSGIQIITNLVGGTLLIFLGIFFTCILGIETALANRRKR
jgi:hypothetical protein